MFQPGEIVRVKSGGPNMTVAFVDSTTGLVVCSWFAGNTPQTDRFNQNVLERVEKTTGIM